MSSAAAGHFSPWACPRVTKLAALGDHEWALQGTCPLWFGKLEKDVSKLCQIVENHCKNQDSLGTQLIKNWPAMHETPVPFLGCEVPQEKGQATRSSVLGLLGWLRW